MFTKSEAGFVLLMDPKNETRMGDKIQTHYWQFPGKQPGKMTELRQSFCEEFLIRSPGSSQERDVFVTLSYRLSSLSFACHLQREDLQRWHKRYHLLCYLKDCTITQGDL